MPKTLHKAQHPASEKPQHAPAKVTPIQYSAKVQTATPEDTTKPLSKEGIKQIQEIVGSFAWYGRETDPTMAKLSVLLQVYKQTPQRD